MTDVVVAFTVGAVLTSTAMLYVAYRILRGWWPM